MTPQSVLSRRDLDTNWVAYHRDRARHALAEADRYAFKAEIGFESAAYYANDLDLHWFQHELNWAFEYLNVARGFRREARRHALMAVRAVELERWPQARAELGRVRRGEARYRGECAAPPR